MLWREASNKERAVAFSFIDPRHSLDLYLRPSYISVSDRLSSHLLPRGFLSPLSRCMGLTERLDICADITVSGEHSRVERLALRDRRGVVEDAIDRAVEAREVFRVPVPAELAASAGLARSNIFSNAGFAVL